MTANPQRDAKGRLLPGQTGNPRGRPKTGLALAEMIREVAGRPGVMRQWVELVFDVAMGRAVCIDADWLRACAAAREAGEAPPARPTTGETIQPDMGAIQRAWEWLGKYGGFTPPTDINLTGGTGSMPLLDFKRLTEDEKDELEAKLAKAAGYADLPPPNLLELAPSSSGEPDR